MSYNIFTGTATVQLTQIVCGECGGTYAISEQYRKQKHEEGGYWKCPYCECSWGYGESEVKRLEKQLIRQKHLVEQAETDARWERQQKERAEHSAASYKGHLSRTKKRVRHGVCPCCNRQFKNLERHMDCKHPGYSE